MTTHDVSLDILLSVVHNRLVCDFDDYRAFLRRMTRSDVPLWEVNRARILVRNVLIGEHPELEAHRPPDKTDSGNAKKWVRSVAAKLGYERLDVKPLRGAMKTRTLSAAL